jgi:hypothetical protein
LVEVDENGTALIPLALLLKEAHPALWCGLIHCMLFPEGLPEEMADSRACLSDIDIDDISHIIIIITHSYKSPIQANPSFSQPFTSYFSLSTHRRWLSSGVDVVKDRMRVSVNSSMMLRLKR